MSKYIIKYLMTMGDATSQWINAVFFFSGNANQSLSGRCWEQREDWFFGRMRRMIDFVALKVFKQSDHCRKAYESDMRRAKLRTEQTRG